MNFGPPVLNKGMLQDMHVRRSAFKLVDCSRLPTAQGLGSGKSWN